MARHYLYCGSRWSNQKKSRRLGSNRSGGESNSDNQSTMYNIFLHATHYHKSFDYNEINDLGQTALLIGSAR